MIIFGLCIKLLLLETCFARSKRNGGGGVGQGRREKKQAEENETAYRRDSVFRCSYLQINLPRAGATSF